MNNLLVAVDITRTQVGYLTYIETLAKRFDAKLWLVYVVQPHPDVVEIPLEQANQWKDKVINKEHMLLQEIALAMCAKGLDVSPVLVQGPVVECLLEIARDIAATMIVVNSHGHGPLYGLVMGSVAEGVSANAVCPVLWVPDAWVHR